MQTTHTHYRTHTCGELRMEHVGQTVTLAGFLENVREVGQNFAFAVLRDFYGVTQVVVENEAMWKAFKGLNKESTVQITGVVRERDSKNPKLPTGDIEVVPEAVEVLGRCRHNELPFQINRSREADESARLKYRYLDLRNPEVKNNIILRCQVVAALRKAMLDHGFLEVTTPILTASSPEGARDYLVPARKHPGKFYALPQAPQQFKQLLMASGFDKYFQIAPCFRDEDARGDRSPGEFYQLDMEMAFADQEDVFAVLEDVLPPIFAQYGTYNVASTAPFRRISYRDAMDKYGSDKPERRFGMKLTDVSSIFENSGFKVFASAVSNGGVVKAINAKGFGSASVGQIDALTKTAVEAGAKGLAYIKVREEDWRSPISKFLSDEEKQKLTEALNIETGDLVLFAAGPWEPSCDILGRVRLQCAEFMELLKDNTERDFLWVIEFPLVGWDEEEQRWVAIHHPFTRPVKEDEEKLLKGELSSDLRAQAYDVVLNGTELGGGSIRIHERDLQSAMFKALGVTEEQAREQFGHILDAFSFGAPPHGGLALGLDRLVMMICNAESIREVIAFPKNNRGADLMSDSPAAAEERQLRDIHIQVKLPAKK